MFMLFGYNYYEILAYIDVSGDKAVEEEDEYMAVFNVAFTLRLVDQQEVKYNDTANNKNMKDVTTEVEFQEEMGVPSAKACTALRAREEMGRRGPAHGSYAGPAVAAQVASRVTGMSNLITITNFRVVFVVNLFKLGG